MHQDRPVALSRSLWPRTAARALTLVVVPTLIGALSGCAGLPWEKPADLRGGYARGDKVAAILPGAGPVAEAADAVRDGVRAAYAADDTGVKPTLAFIASEQPAKIADAHQEAVAAGATQVIGPLLKPAVDALASGPALKVPTLALNQANSPGKAAGNLYQFALAPEAEAADAANQAKALGFDRALILAPAGEAGQRRADAFRRQWEKIGGTLVGQAAFGAGTDAPTKPLAKPAVNAAAKPGSKPDATPVAKPAAADYTRAVNGLLDQGQADVLFLAADGEQARTVYPAIRAAASIPVIATSAVYSGTTDAARDQTLAGLYFVDLPWVLGVGEAGDPAARVNLKRGLASVSNPLGLRLYAMGIDAYRLAPRLAALARDPAATFPGATGTLSLDALGRVQRQLTLAQFTGSGVQPVAATPAATGSRWPFATPAKPAPSGEPAAAPPPAQAAPKAQGPRPEPAARHG